MKLSLLPLLFILLLSSLVACTPTAANSLEPPAKINTAIPPRPSRTYTPFPTPPPANLNAPSANEPASDFFYLLPTQEVGELVTIDEYAIQIVDFHIDEEQLFLELYLENNSLKEIDLGWAIQLRDGDGNLIPAIQEDNSLASKQMVSNTTRTQLNLYDLSKIKGAEDSFSQPNKYSLLYAPVGWSGPVFTFELLPTKVEGS